jgi:hypothetical protein
LFELNLQVQVGFMQGVQLVQQQCFALHLGRCASAVHIASTAITIGTLSH